MISINSEKLFGRAMGLIVNLVAGLPLGSGPFIQFLEQSLK